MFRSQAESLQPQLVNTVLCIKESKPPPTSKTGQSPILTEYLTTTAAAKSLQSCPTLCDPIDGSPPGSPLPGILQARLLE